MRHLVSNLKTLCAVFFVICGASPVFGQQFTTLYSFTGGSDGAFPVGDLTLSGNYLYGAANGGGQGYGTIFSLNTSGTAFSSLYQFTNGNDGAYPSGQLVQAGGTLFGTAQYGGSDESGTVFSINTDGSAFTVLYTFTGDTDGAYPTGTLTLVGSNLYGAALGGGVNDSGTIFSLSTNGSTFNPVYTFTNGVDGSGPNGGLILSGQTLYGTEGASDTTYGTVFSLNISGSNFTTLHNFTGTDGDYPICGLVQSVAALYGTTVGGGSTDNGVVFTVNTNGSGFSTLYSFTGGADGGYPYAPLTLSAGVLYGTTTAGGSDDNGVVFSLNVNGSGFTNIYIFTDGSDGSSPYSGLVLSGSVFYGAASGGGVSGSGTVFEISASGSNPLQLNFSAGTSYDVTLSHGNETDPSIAVNPFNVSNLFVAGVSSATNGLISSYTTNGSTWVKSIIASTNDTNHLIAAYGEPSVAWDVNSNLFIAYEPASFQGIAVAFSTNGGKTFTLLTNLAPNDVTDQPRITTAALGSSAGSVWLVYKDFSLPGTPLVVQGLQTSGPGTNQGGIGPFSPPLLLPGSTNGGFPDIAVGPNYQVMVAYQNNVYSASTSKVFVSVNNNPFGGGTFGQPVTVTSDAIGGFTYIPAEKSANGVNAGVGVAWDSNPASPYFNRAYVTYTSAETGHPAAINVDLRYSITGGASWSGELQVNDDTNSLNSHFFPRVTVDPTTGGVFLCWYDCRNDIGSSANNPVSIPGSTNVFVNVFDLDGIPNDDFMIYLTASLTGGASFAPNIPMFSTNVSSTATPLGSKTYVSEAVLATNANGIGHHIGLTSLAGNVFPVWADNSGFISGNPDLPNNTNFDLDVGDAILQTADLGVTVRELPNPPTSDEVIAYYVVITNGGPFAAPNVTVTDTLVDDETLVGVSPAAGASYFVSDDDEVITFYLSTLAPYTSLTNLIRVTATQSGFITNVVTVISSLPDPIQGNNSSNLIVLINGADLSVSMALSTNTFVDGQPVTDTLTIVNLGPETNSPVFLTNTFSANFTNLFILQAPPNFTYTNYLTNGFSYLVFNAGFLPVNQPVTLQVSITPAGLSTSGSIAASIGSADYDTNLLNNSTNYSAPVAGEDLAITMNLSPNVILDGETITNTITIQNLGPAVDGNIVFSNIYPAGWSNLNIVQASGGGSVSSNVVVLNIGTLGVNQTATLILTIIPSGTSSYGIITAAASSQDSDPNLGNNGATLLVSVGGESLSVSQTPSVTNAAVGQTVTYTLSVTNLGPSPYGNITVTDTPSSLLSQITVLHAPYPPVTNGSALVFSLGPLAQYQSTNIVFTAVARAIGNATNIVTASVPFYNPNSAADTVSSVITIGAPPAAISNFTVTAYASSAFLVWDTSFLAPAVVQVQYGLTTNYGQMTSLSGPAIHHVVMLTGLNRDATYYYNALTWENGVLYPISGSFSTEDTIILNTVNASYVGPWVTGSLAVTNFYGSYYNVVSTTPYNSTASATYSPDILSPGLYNVSVWYPQATNFSANAQMYVTGATNEILDSVNQTTNGGRWFPLASNLDFVTGYGGNVAIYNGTGETNRLVAANAMKWAYVNSQDYPTNGVVPSWYSTFYFGTNTAEAATNYAEYVFGTPPNDPADTPDISLAFPGSNVVQVTFMPYQGGRFYQLQTSTNLAGSYWSTLTNQVIFSTNAVGIYTNGTGYGMFNVVQTNAAQTFFRISAQIIPQ